jgi:hypothetical protein
VYGADIVTYSQKPHGQEMDTSLVIMIIKSSKVRYKRHRKELVDLGGAQNWGFVCSNIRGMVCHISPPVAAAFASRS